jgi:hypothetical protein
MSLNNDDVEKLNIDERKLDREQSVYFEMSDTHVSLHDLNEAENNDSSQAQSVGSVEEIDAEIAMHEIYPHDVPYDDLEEGL